MARMACLVFMGIMDEPDVRELCACGPSNLLSDSHMITHILA